MRWDEDPVWAEARERTRDEVRAAFAKRRIKCANCGFEAETSSRTCPNCGKPYVATRNPVLTREGRRKIAIGLLIAIAVLGGLAALIVPQLKDSTSDANAKDEAAQQRLFARTRAELAVDQKLHTTRAPRARSAGAAAVAVEQAVERDIKARVRAGALKGPVLRTDCEPYAPRPRTGSTLRFECTAVTAIVNRQGKEAGVLGYPVWAKADIAAGRLYWCKVNPKPGEKATNEGQLDVALDPRCNLTR